MIFNDRGQVLMLSLIVLSILMIVTTVIISGSFVFSQSSKYSLDGVAALNLAEAGVDKAVASLNSTGGAYNGETETQLGVGSYSVNVTDQDASTKIIEATGYIPNKTNPKVKRTIKILISKGVGVAFNYGVQVGAGGLTMQNNARINGSIYSNGSITMNNGSKITGDAYVAGGVQPNADQQTDCSSPNCLDYLFGKTISGENRLDIAQSFRPSSTAVINKVALKLKKFGSPPNLTVRILGNNGSNPNKNDVKTSGTLSASLVTNQYGFIEVAFTSSPTLSADTTYWIVIDTSSDTNNYWAWSQDSLGSYTGGNAKWSTNWQASSPVWNSISGDLGFETFMGGTPTYILGTNNSQVDGNAHANTLQNIIIGSHAYYQVQSGITVNGQNCTSNANCHPGSTDPVPQTLPISEANVQNWKDEALSGGVQSGDITGCPSTLARKKYEGFIKLTNGCTTTIESPIWITGSLELDNGALMRLNSSYGAASGIIVVDGTIKLSNNGRLQGSGIAGSYMIGLSNYDSTITDNIAIEADNGSTSVILYANKGHILLKNGASLKEVVGHKLQLDNGATVTYESGLSGLFFSSGPSGSYAVIKGTYQDK